MLNFGLGIVVGLFVSSIIYLLTNGAYMDDDDQ